MDCGTPFCNNGCPVNNIIPDFNELVLPQRLEAPIAGAALDQQLPEFTPVRVCRRASAEAACTLNGQRTTGGHQVDRNTPIIDRAWAEGLGPTSARDR